MKSDRIRGKWKGKRIALETKLNYSLSRDCHHKKHNKMVYEKMKWKLTGIKGDIKRTKENMMHES